MKERIDQGFENELPEGGIKELTEKRKRKQMRAVRLLRRNVNIRSKMRQEWDQIQLDYDLAGNVQSTPQNSELTHSHKTRDVSKKIKQKLDLHAWDIEIFDDLSVESMELTKATMKSTVKELMRMSNRYRCFKGEKGVHSKFPLYGDAFVIPEFDERRKAIKMKVHSLDSVYFNPKATSMRNSPDGMDVNNVIIIYDYDDWDDFIEKFGENKDFKNIKWGRIPHQESEFESLSLTVDQENSDCANSPGQVAVEINIDTEEVTTYAGENMWVIKEIEGTKFPYRKMHTKEPYIPVFRYFFSERSNGFYNDGVGHLLSERTNVDTMITNSVIQGVKNNALPLRKLDVYEDKVEEVDASLYRGLEDLDAGGLGIMYNPVEKNRPVLSGKIENVSGSFTNTEGLTVIDNMINSDIVNLGVNIKDVNSDPNKTASAVHEDNVAGIEIIQEISRQNAPEDKELIEAVIQLNTTVIKESDDRKINIDRKIFGDIPAKNATLGRGIALLKTIDYRITMTDVSGVTPDSTVKRREDVEVMSTAAAMAPGAPINMKLLLEYLESQGKDIKEDDLVVPQPEQPEQAQQLLPQQ